MEITCGYSNCPNRKKSIKDILVCTVCRERLYCSQDCLTKDWNELHSNICLSFPKGAKDLKFSVDDFEPLYSEKSKNDITNYGMLGTSRLVKHVSSPEPAKAYVMKTISKKLLAEIGIEKEKVEKFYRRMKELKHPHILQTYHFTEDEKNVYLVLDCAANGCLRDLLNLNEKLTEEESFVLFVQCALGLEYLHSLDLIHGDMKVDNILLTSINDVMICDYGYNISNLIMKKKLCNGVEGMEAIAPEVIVSNSQDQKGDIWGLGVILYELIHGYTPFQAKDYKSLLENIRNVRNFSFEPKLSEDLIDLITKMLTKNPLTRITLPEIFEHSWIQRHDRMLGTNVAEFRLKSNRGGKNERDGEESKSPLQTEEKGKELDQGFSPQLSPTRKLKKKPLLKDIFSESREGELKSNHGEENLGPKGSFFEGLLRMFGNLCKC